MDHENDFYIADNISPSDKAYLQTILRSKGDSKNNTFDPDSSSS